LIPLAVQGQKVSLCFTLLYSANEKIKHQKANLKLISFVPEVCQQLLKLKNHAQLYQQRQNLLKCLLCFRLTFGKETFFY